MRSSRKFLASLAVLTAIFVSSVGSIPVSEAGLSQTQKDSLIAQRTQLVIQLNVLLAQRGGAAANLGAAEQQYLDAQNQVLAVKKQLDATNSRLTQLAQQIATEQKHDGDAQRQLALLTRASYESVGDRSILANVLSSQTFSDAMTRMKGADSVDTQVAALQVQLSKDQIAIATQRAGLQTQFTQASTLEKQLSDQSNKFLIAVASRNVELSHASAPVRALEAQIADIDNQLAGNAPPVNGGATCGNRFAFGQCTYYVATRRCIPWTGNANQWFANAAKMGYLEGHTPAVGAVVVFWPGGDGASSVGHVGYVEQVGPAGGIPAGYFQLSEMNFGGWDKVNYRVLPGNSSGIQGFIYGHA